MVCSETVLQSSVVGTCRKTLEVPSGHDEELSLVQLQRGRCFDKNEPATEGEVSCTPSRCWIAFWDCTTMWTRRSWNRFHFARIRVPNRERSVTRKPTSQPTQTDSKHRNSHSRRAARRPSPASVSDAALGLEYAGLDPKRIVGCDHCIGVQYERFSLSLTYDLVIISTQTKCVCITGVRSLRDE